ncbi:type II toxin-antitoxin system prevent-host-death family antitoxin [Variovorax ginsengisoli]|uniref:Type II toxin-antitoxin system prevent-host-death family antitoxin n=1 Tax=Variovorax ginsengisoli TaxID=363844 RepID=A0ABT8SAC0_9BURK|nr:type II toxin-antitoxin system prevent-host-death family antitoxin [Variovorax ginsengisoli]MDN8616575.1 type II toxin-antitoxin system prevent-host-death family antitoxin [Variovorax ginsengisoli]MDO1535745.1 type II toxin-antitoxin system prevent-host-death family antitoxin [Variovorax ginsengisoli]
MPRRFNMTSVHTFSSRDFTRDVGAAKRAAAEGPVFITDRGRPAFALLKIEDYYRITGEPEKSLLDLMDSLPSTEGIDFEPSRVDIEFKPAEFG